MKEKPNKEGTKSINKYVKLAPLLSRGELIVVNLYFELSDFFCFQLKPFSFDLYFLHTPNPNVIKLRHLGCFFVLMRHEESHIW